VNPSSHASGARSADARWSVDGIVTGVRVADAVRPHLRGDAPSRPAAVVELIGPPGAGKTTLRRAVLSLEPRSLTIRIDRRRDLAVVARTALGLVRPVVAAVAQQRHLLSWRDAVQHTRLRALRPAVARAAASGAPLALLDEGPVYALAKLEAYGHVSGEEGFFGTRWRDALARWREVVDLVVWLDAPDALLVRRIRGRAKAHPVKVAGPLEATRFISRYRAAYDTIVARMCTSGGPRLLRLDTSTGDAVEHAARVIETLDVLQLRGDAPE
jgi:hypothetical protein